MKAENRARDWTQMAIRRWQHALLKKLANHMNVPIYIVLGQALFDMAEKYKVSTDEFDEERSVLNA